MYDNYGPEFTNVLEMISLSAIKDSSQKFNAFDFFQKREEVQATFEVDLAEKLLQFGIRLTKLIILDITLPYSFDNAIK